MSPISQLLRNSLVATGLLLATTSQAADVLVQRSIGMELARDVANEAVVVDRNASVRAVLRDDAAPRFTADISRRKANMVIMGGTASGTVVENRADIRNELNHIDGLIMLKGGLPIIVGGYRIGAVGVSGAPGGDHALEDRIAFSD